MKIINSMKALLIILLFLGILAFIFVLCLPFILNRGHVKSSIQTIRALSDDEIICMIKQSKGWFPTLSSSDGEIAAVEELKKEAARRNLPDDPWKVNPSVKSFDCQQHRDEKSLKHTKDKGSLKRKSVKHVKDTEENKAISNVKTVTSHKNESGCSLELETSESTTSFMSVMDSTGLW